MQTDSPSQTTPSHVSISNDSPGGVPASQTPNHPSFRRQRASRACETCHSRKVRCDAASLGVPCTNCVAFSLECKIPTPRRKKTQSKAADNESVVEASADAQSTPTAAATEGSVEDLRDKLIVQHADAKRLGFEEAEHYVEEQSFAHNGAYAIAMKPRFVRAPIKEAGRVAYIGESSNLSLLVADRYGTTDVVHYPLPDNSRGARARLNELDNAEVDILHRRGAFLLPPRALCDELVEAYFTWVAPIVPVINRSRFMRHYRDPKNQPSLLLLQAVLLAGSRVCANPQLMDSNGSTTPAAMTFYKRAKALYDANYEDDRVTIVQALVLMGWYWEGPEDVTKNVFYWTRVALIVAQGSGMHRSVEASQLGKTDKRLWKRIWWSLFCRDRSVAVALGRPCGINTDDADVEMLTEEDFIDDESDRPSEYPPDPIHVQFFLNYVKLCEIMGLVLSQQYSVACKRRKHNALDLMHSDMALADWLQNCPKEVFWVQDQHHFWSALLHAHYYTTLCLLHRAHMPPAGVPTTTMQNGYIVENTYPSRNIAYQAAGMVTSIIENLQKHDQVRFTPAFIVYSLFSALIMHVYQMRSSNSSVVATTEKRMETCMSALKEVSKVWIVAKMVHTLFESILGNRHLEERLQKAAGNRHKKRPAPIATPRSSSPQIREPPTHKRKFEEVDGPFSNGPPAPQMSYERSRPQTPALTSPRDVQPQSGLGNTHSMQEGLEIPRQDAFMGASRSVTRAGSPTHLGPSYPGTPPDLFLVTRNSPTIPEDLWNNFQPDQLFPADTNLNFSPPSQVSMIDPQLATQHVPPPLHSPQPMSMATQQASMSMSGNQQQQTMQSYSHMQSQMQQQQNGGGGSMPQHSPHSWAHVGAMNSRPQMAAEDTWSNSSVGAQAPIVPNTLNVEEWFHFFGMQGMQDMSGLQQAFAA